MALKDIFALIDDKLHDVFHTVAYDPARDREAFAKRIDDTKAKFLSTEPPRGRKDFAVANNVVEYRPTLRGGGAVKMNGKDVSYIPAERFTDFLDGLKAAVIAGDLDKELEAAASSGTSTITSKMENTGAPRVKRVKLEGEESEGGRGWSAERREKFAATVAARKAAKAGGAG